ncbi:hydroxymethylglutaryl-CoA lyase [Orrella sp. 11846]|uniref:hydroxymethylglutaryl-CoA lyase n=1 Tax=Orrella sp. 11846 TaxID=3409913 RepID=UPI003B5A52AE
MTQLPSKIRINEEGPREGFQIEKNHIPTERKIELIDSLSQTGLQQIQTVSFVPPKNVPGMADADDVVNGFTRFPDVEYTALWLNERGLRRALNHSKLDIKGYLSLCASTAFLAKNQKRTPQENLQAARDLLQIYQDHEISIHRLSLMAAFGCNFEGDISPSTVVKFVRQMTDLLAEHNMSANHVSLADTMAWATPASIKRVVSAVQDAFPTLDICLHLHDTRGMGIANAYAGLEMGVALFDACVGGLGGCPFAAHKGAAGNVCTEDLVFMCDEMGIETGIDLNKIIESALLAEEIVGHPLPGSVKTGGSLAILRENIAKAKNA